MPAYDYRCENCHTIFLVKASFTTLEKHKEEIVCPNCGSENVTRLVNKGVNVIYKGEGFYTTDKGKENDEKV